jgi:indole-3-glycerol phosphate synthase
MKIIAEVKTHSPFGWKSNRSWDYLFKLADRIGDIISIHTDPRWNGSFDLVKKAKEMTDKPILAKGIHASDNDIQKAINSGADYVLVVGRIPKIHLDKCLIEPLTFEELGSIDPSLKAVWNSRDLSDGSNKLETFDDARNNFSGWLCQASNISRFEDIHPKADAVLIGTHLESIADQIKKQK